MRYEKIIADFDTNESLSKKLAIYGYDLSNYIFLFFFRYILFFAVQKNRTHILILGANNLARKIIMESKTKRFRGYNIVGVATTLENQVGVEIEGIKALNLIDPKTSLELRNILKRKLNIDI